MQQPVDIAYDLSARAELLSRELREARDELDVLRERLAAHEKYVKGDLAAEATVQLFLRKGVGLTDEQRRRRSERLLRQWDES